MSSSCDSKSPFASPTSGEFADVVHTHWEKFYASEQARAAVAKNCSQFALFSLPYIQAACQGDEETTTARPFIELGCGTGRDFLFFHQHLRAPMFACDAAASAVQFVTSLFSSQDLAQSKQFASPEVFQCKFSQLGNQKQTPDLYGAIYARFVIHAIPASEALALFAWSAAHLTAGGVLCVEARSVNDALFGKGIPVEKEADAFISGHYRRFIRHSELNQQLTSVGFELLYSQESEGWSRYGDDDPVLIRCVAHWRGASDQSSKS
jgi:hypothetical protein